MKATKILTALSLLALSATGASAYDEVKCNTDATFAANSCDQCFTGGAKGEGDNLGFLKDEWVNSSQVDKMLYKEEQEMPKMINLNEGLVSWKSVPGTKGFWEYTADFNKLYQADEEGYVLAKGQKVVWLESKKGYAYSLEKNRVEAGKNIGMLVYALSTHNISENGNVNTDPNVHNECVLFTSGTPKPKVAVNPGTKETPKVGAKTPAKKLPNTGPEHYILLMLLAMVLGFGIMKMRKNA
ncbi:hypothetical protein LR004_00010 [Candidatus Gracilibacteria bacterium]|nr:hypothetical protein [Candidatus Gracilibacteria bacterium]